ncbi:MAG: arsenate reductase ArsC [Chloroflexi bacterium]|nr:MAG: arsenate reductase ArsC [Chloroflexota bacterium]
MKMTTKVLFLCTGNSARSQMAEAFLRKYGASQFEPFSAGLEPKGLNPLTVRVMEEIGFDMSGHRSKGIDEYLGKEHFQYLVTVCHDAEQNCPRVWPGVNQRLHWSFENPAAFEGSEEEMLEKFRQVRDQIQEKVRSWLKEISDVAIS